MRNFVTRLRVWFPPPLILLLFFVTDVLTAIPRFTFDIVNIVLSVWIGPYISIHFLSLNP